MTKRRISPKVKRARCEAPLIWMRVLHNFESPTQVAADYGVSITLIETILRGYTKRHDTEHVIEILRRPGMNALNAKRLLYAEEQRRNYFELAEAVCDCWRWVVRDADKTGATVFQKAYDLAKKVPSIPGIRK